MVTVCRFQIARHLAKGKDILELTGLPGFLVPVGSKTGISTYFDRNTHAPNDIAGSQVQQGTATAATATAADSPRGCATSRSEGSRKLARTDSVPSGANDASDKS